jgi:hypothetical protein
MTEQRRRRGRPPKSFVTGQDENGREVRVTYQDLGLTRQRAHLARQLAAISRDVFEEHLAMDGDPMPGLRRLARHYYGAADDERIKIRTDDPARAAWAIASHCPAGFVGELIAFLGEYLRAAEGRGVA